MLVQGWRRLITMITRLQSGDWVVGRLALGYLQVPTGASGKEVPAFQPSYSKMLEMI
jgi:hypothetical protein